MESKNLLTLAITLTVGIILAGSLMMPVISDATETQKTFTNDGYMRYTSIESTAENEITIEWDHSAPDILTIGEETIDLTKFDRETSILFGDNWSLRYLAAGDFQYIGDLNVDYLFVSKSGTDDLNITLDAGDVTLVSGTTTKTNTYTTAYYTDNDGTMIMKKANESAYLLKDSSIISANGITNVPGGSVGIRFTGTIKDGFDFTYYRNSAGWSESNVVAHYEQIAKYTELVSLSNITFDLDATGQTTQGATYSYFLIPYEVTAQVAQPLSSGEIVILNALPILIIVALVVMAAGALYLKRDD